MSLGTSTTVFNTTQRGAISLFVGSLAPRAEPIAESRYTPPATPGEDKRMSDRDERFTYCHLCQQFVGPSGAHAPDCPNKEAGEA